MDQCENWFKRTTRSRKPIGGLCMRQMNEVVKKKSAKKRPVLQKYIKSKKSDSCGKKKKSAKAQEKTETETAESHSTSDN